MPRLLKLPKITYSDRLLAGFLSGVLCGTVVVNLLGRRLGEQAGYFESLLVSASIGREERTQLFLYVCRQRVLETLFGWILGLTVFSAPCFCLLAAYGGFSLGMVLSMATVQRGVMGLPCYLLTMFPQYLLYLPVWLILASWAGQRSGKIRLLPMTCLLVLTSAGAAAETWLNPLFLQVLR